jgi:predicted DNA repair protein MutK
MPSGLIALLDDVAALTKLAAASVDDVGLAAGKAGAKAAGVVIDDTAVTPRYVTGLLPERELPIIAKITVGSLRNKLLVILPVALLLAAFAPFLIPPILMIGGAYLAYEATEKILERVTGDQHDECELFAADTPAELEARQVAGAIRTDFILSAEIMVIALAELGEESLAMQAGALVAVAIGITFAVYGVVALIVKLDDIGLHLTRRRNATTRAIGSGLVHGVPHLLTGLSRIGTAAMLWVGGGIFLHGMDELQFDTIPHAIHDGAHEVAGAIGLMVPAVEWLANAVAASIAGLIVGGLIVGLLHLRSKRQQPAEATDCPPEIV